MNHRSIIKWLIVMVISIVVVWSVINISDYAYTFHANWIVYTMGLALGTANALSVYAFVMAKTPEVKRPAVFGIVLFGGMSGVLQTLLYLQVGAPMLAALSFGWFGPVAEGVLAWLHAALSEEPASRKPQRNTQTAATSAGGAGTQGATTTATQAAKPAVTERARTAAALAAQGMKQQAIADQLGIKLRTVQMDLQSVRAASLATNGKEHA